MFLDLNGNDEGQMFDTVVINVTCHKSNLVLYCSVLLKTSTQPKLSNRWRQQNDVGSVMGQS